MATHTVLLLGLVLIGIVLFTMFFLNSPAGRFALKNENGRLTFAEWVERTAHEDDDAQRS